MIRNTPPGNRVARTIPFFFHACVVLIASAVTAQAESQIAHSGSPNPEARGAGLYQEKGQSGRAKSAGRSDMGVRLQTMRPNGPTGADPLFLPPVKIDLGLGFDASTAVAVGDLNGDGKVDLVVGSCNDNCDQQNGFLSVLLGKGDGTFQAPTTFPSCGARPSAVSLADFNNDSKLDLVVSHFDGAVCFYRGNGDGTFRAAEFNSAVGTGSDSLAVADLNGDGKLDLAVAFEFGPGGGGFGVWLGNGDGTFQPVNYFPFANGTNFVAVLDVDQDGKPDLVVTDRSGGLRVWRGNGDGTFLLSASYSSGGIPWSVVVADMNGDGQPDLVVGDQCVAKQCLEVGVLLGNHDGTFQPVRGYDSGVGDVGPLAVADVNGDGYMDAVACTVGTSHTKTTVLLGNGDGSLQVGIGYDGGAGKVVLSDLNNDGRPDIIEPAVGVEVMINNTGPHSASATTLSSNPAPAAPNQLVTYTATVNSQYAGPVTGTVTFREKSKLLAIVPVSGGMASYSASYPNIGKHLITAGYSGDYYSAGSTSAVLAQYVEILPVNSTTHITTSGTPSHAGQPVTFTAQVTSTFGPILNGELVTFYDGTVVIGTGTTAGGFATFTTSSLSVKRHTIKAVYAGDATFKSSRGHVVQVVEP